MKDFATENQARDDLSVKPSTVELQASDGPVTAYVLLSREPEEFNSAAQSVSYGSMELSSAKVYADEAEAIGFAEVTGAKLEKVEIPGGLARDVFLEKWTKAAKKNKQGLLPFLLLPLAACGGGGGGPVTFTVTEAANLISFGGTATGDITAETTGVTTTFTRGTLTGTADNVFAAGAPKQIVAASGQTVVVTGAQINGAELKASGAGNVTINATDAGAGTVTTVSSKIDVVLTGGTLTFDMSNDNEDTITLTAGSVINLGGGTLIVSDGKVNASGIGISNVGGVTLNSTLVVDLADFKEIQDAGGFTGTGTLEVNPSASDTVTNATNLGAGGVGVAAGAINNAEFTEAEYLALFIGGVGGNANAVGNLATLAANSVTIVGSVSNTTVLASLETNAAKIVAGGVTAITLADDAAVNTFDGLIANAGVAANSVTVTNGAITSAGAKAAIVASVAKFKADQIDSITLTDAEAAVTGFLADDAFNANSVTIGAVTTSEAAVLANGREIANNGITAITITAAEFDTFIDANTNAPFADESVTLGDVTTNQADVVTNIAKVVDGGIASITLTLAQFATVVGGGVNSLDALQSHSVTISDPTNLAGAITQAEVQVGLALVSKGSVTLDASGVTGLTGTHAELMSLYASNAAGTVSGLGNENLVANDAGISVSEANNLAAKTSGTLTATLSSTALADYAALEGTGNAYTIAIADAAIDADALQALNAKTTVNIDLTGDTSISGTLANVNAVVAETGVTNVLNTIAVTITDTITAAQAETLVGTNVGNVTATIAAGTAAGISGALTAAADGNDNFSITLTDSSVDPALLNTLDSRTATDIDVSAVNTISGANAAIVTLYGNTANFVGLGNENITASDASITVAQAVALLGFTSGSLTGTITAAGATTTQLASLAAFDSQIAGTITNLTLGITASTAAQSRSAQFDGLTDNQAQALFNHAAGGVTITGNAGADWIDLRGFNTTGVDFTINALAGDNRIYSGDGNDTITTTTGADFINVGGGRDTVNAGTGIDQIEVESLDNVDGSVYDGGGDADTLTVKGINDLTNTVQTSLETLDLKPGSPSEVTLTGSQAEAFTAIQGTAGNSKLTIQVEMAKVTFAGAGAKLDGGGTDTVTFTYQGAAKTVTGNFSTLAELQTAVDAQVGGAGNVFASLTNGNADVTLTVKALGETITAPGYANNGGGNVAGAAAAEDAAVDMSGVIFQNLAELKADAGVGIALSIANVANIGAVESDNNSVGLDLDGSAISSDLDISAMSLTPASGVVNLTVNSGATFTATAAQVVSTNPAFATTGAGTTKIIGASGTVQNSTLELNANGVVNTTAVIVDVGANMSVTTDALQNVTAFNINAGKTLTIDSDKVSAKTVTGDGAMIVNIGTDNFNLANVAGTVSSSGTVTGNTTLHGSANLGTLTTTVNNGVTLQLLGTQADGKTINGAGAVTVNDLDGDAAADLSKITVAGTKTAKVANNVTFTGDLNGFGVDVAATKTITSTAAKLTGLSVIDSTGNAGITVTDLGTAAFNAANFSVGGALLVKTATSSGANSITLNAATNVVGATAATKTIDITETGDTLVATAAQLDALVVTDTATSNVTVTALGNTDFDASSFSIAGNLLVQTVASGGADTITLGAGTDIVGATAAAKAIDITETGDTLVATAAQLTAATVTDTATSNVTVTALGGTAFNANNFNINGNLLVKTVASGGADTITLHGTTNILGATAATKTIDITETGDTLAATAAQLTGATVTDTATSNVTVTALGNTAFNADNFSIAGNLLVQTVSAAGDVTLNASTNIVGATAASKTISITDDDTLTGTAAQLTGVAVTDAGTANVTVTALGNTAFDASNFSIAGNLLVQTVNSGGGDTITLDAATDLFGGTLGGTKTLSITDNGDTLTATAAQLTGAAVTDVGTAHIIVNDLTNAVTFDASNFSTAGNLTVNTKSDAGTSIALTAGAKINNATTAGTETINIVDTGDTLTGTVAQLTGLTITDTAVGNVTATALDGAAAYDFSNVSIDGNLLVQTVASGGAAATITLNGGTDIAGATVAAGKTKTINMTEGDVLVATGAQLSGVNVTESANAIVRVSNTTFSANTDLSGVRTNAIEFGAGNNTDLVLGNGVILSLREAHLTNLVGDNGADASIGDGSNTGHVKIYEFTGDSDLVEIDVAGNITGYVSTAQTIVGDEAKIEELDALVIQSGGSLALTQVQANAFATTLTKEAGAGNVTSSVTGDLSALNLSVVDALTLTGATTLVDSTADLKAAAAINAASQAITVNNAIDLTAKTITNYGNLTVDTNQLTVSAEQIAGFTGGGTVAKTNGGLIKVHVGSTTNISGLDTSDASSIVLNTSGSDVTMTTAQNLQVADGVGTNTITLSNNGTTNGVAGIENYILSSAGANSFTLASNTAQVTGGTNNDTIVGGTGASTIIGGQGVDILSGDNGADIFSFSTGHTGITALTADRILDFATGVDQIKINGTKGDVVEADGANMLFSGFTSAATAAFNGGIDIYAAYNVSGSGDTYVAIDHNASGTFNSGDSLIVLNNLNLDNQLVAGDFIA